MMEPDEDMNARPRERTQKQCSSSVANICLHNGAKLARWTRQTREVGFRVASMFDP